MVSSFVPYSRQPSAAEQLLVVARALSTKLIRVTNIHYLLQSKQGLHLFNFLSMYNSFSNLLTRGVFCSSCK